VTRVLVIDDHPIVLHGCRQLFADAGVDDIVQALSLSEGFNVYNAQKPDMILVDLAMQTDTVGGLSFIRKLRRRDKRTPLIVFSMHRDPVIVRRAIELGATGYVLKDAPPEELLKAFQTTRGGKRYLSHELASDMAFRRAEKTSPFRNLTPRELQTLTLIAEGQTLRAIAESLNLSYKTVSNTRTRLKAKLGANTLPGLMRLAIEHLPSQRLKAARRWGEGQTCLSGGG
jgi:two-component system, NarL family, invasion response regulator UvrY